jgi:hypothetical protein
MSKVCKLHHWTFLDVLRFISAPNDRWTVHPVAAFAIFVVAKNPVRWNSEYLCASCFHGRWGRVPSGGA